MDPFRRFPPSADIFSFRQPVSATSTSAAAVVDPSAKSRPRPRLDVQSRQIHRNRISYSCHACRRRKVKCDRLQPICSNCTKSAESCVYDEHVTRDKGVGVDVDVGAGRAGDGAGGVKRRRTVDSAAEDGAARSNGSPSSPPQKAPDGAKQAELETRMDRLAEIVNRWYKDASVHGVRESGVRGVGGGGGSGGVSGDGGGGGGGSGGPPAAENGFAQSQHFLDLLQQSTGPLRTAQSSSSSSPPPQTSPASSAGHSGETPMDQISALSHSSGLTVGMLDAGIEAARRSGKDEEVGDLGLGHLSIQGGGRSRYVGTSFWGLLSSEVRVPLPPPLSLLFLFFLPLLPLSSDTHSR